MSLSGVFRARHVVVGAGCAALVAACVLGSAAAQPAADAAGKPVAPFSVVAEALGPAAVGLPVDVRIAIDSRVALDDIEVRLSADPGLSVDAADLTLRAPSASPGQPAEWRITVVPIAEGAHRLRLFGEAAVDGTRQGRSTIATIRVGAGAAAERDSTVRGVDRGSERATGPRKPQADDGDRDAEAEEDVERVIRLPAVVRPQSRGSTAQ